MGEMLLQSTQNRVDVFPAVPKVWPNIQFHRLRAGGAFLVIARREDGMTRWVLIAAEAGGRTVVDLALDSHIWDASQSATLKSIGSDGYQINGPESGTFTLWDGEDPIVISAIDPTGPPHRFGLSES